MNSIRNILICGAGMMGKNIAFVMSSNPAYQIALYDIHPTNVAAGIRINTKQLVDKEVLSQTELEERLSRISFTDDIDSSLVSSADFVIEAVFEDMNIKQDTFAKLEARCRKDTIFCTNSSVMSPSQISEKLEHRERFAGTHFWNPAYLIPLVEVINTKYADPSVIQEMCDIFKCAGKMPVVVKKDVPGFLANRLQHALFREAISIVEHGIASPKDVDEAIKYGFGMRVGISAPFEVMDMCGLDLTESIHSYLFPHIEDAHEAQPLLKQNISEGRLGFKSQGRGFVDWSQQEMDDAVKNLNVQLIQVAKALNRL